MPQLIRKIILSLSVGVMAFSIVVSPLLSSTAVAASEHPQDRLERWLFYRGMRACLEDGLDSNSKLERSSVMDGKWNPVSDKDGFGYVGPRLDDNNDNDGTVDCNDGSIWVQGAKIFGFSNAVELLCAIDDGLKEVGDGSRLTPNNGDCMKATSFDVVRNGDWQQALTKALDKKGNRPQFNINDNPNSGAMKYLIGANSLTTFCNNGGTLQSGIDGLGNDENGVSVDIVEIPSGTVKKSQIYRLGGERNNQGDKVDDVWYNPGGNSNEAQDLKCQDLAQMTRDYSGAYAQWIRANPETIPSPVSDTSDNPTDEESTTCAVEGIGWIICPVVNFLGQITDKMYDILDNNLLEVPAGQIFDTNGYAYQAWSTMRNIANVAFVIAFLFIIYAQITGMGITNYGVKKLLPKIVIAAILVNTSFWLCAIAVDVSNIAGYSTKNMFDSAMAANSSFAIEGVGTLETGSWWTQLGVGILAASGLVYVGLSVLLPALVVVSFAVITVVAVLAVRQALVILLIVISPLAFVAYLLPNTESWFKKWLGLFRTMLLIFPIISAVFGASALASIIIMGVAEEEDSIIIGVVGALISIVPLFITPILMRSAGGVLNRVGGFINNPNKGPFDRARKAAEGYRSKRKDINKADRLNGTSTFGRRAAKWKDSNNRFTRGAGTVLGASSTPGELIAGGLAGRKLTKDKQAASAKAAAEFAEQNYVATRASNENSGYAQKIAGPTGSASLAQAYAIEAMQKEAIKDRAAEKTIFEHNGTSFKDLGEGIRAGAFSGAREEAALQRYFETANSDGVQGMLEHINTMRSNPNLEGDALKRAKELTQVTGEALANSPLKPKNLSASNLNNLRNGEAIQAEASRIASTIAEGKINASSIGQMDIDEIRRWTSNMVENSSLLAAADPGKIEATRQAIIDAENDARINVKFGDRERDGLAQLKEQLIAQLAVADSPIGQKARQDAAAGTYGPNI